MVGRQVQVRHVEPRRESKRSGAGLRIFISILPFLLLVSCGSDSGPPTQQVGLTPAERAFVKAHPTIRVGVEMDWPPFDFVIGGRAAGFANDHVSLLAARLGIKVEFIHGQTWAELETLLRKREIDVLPAIWKTPERETVFAYTRAYHQSPIVLVVRAGTEDLHSLDDLNGLRLAVVEGYASGKSIARSHPEIELVPFSTPVGALLAVSNGKADAYTDELAVVNYIRRQQLIEGLETVGLARGKSMGEPLHLAVRGDWPELARLLEKAMDTVSSAEYAELSDRWLTPPSTPATGDRSFLEVVAIVVSGLLLLALLLWFLTRFGGRWIPLDFLMARGKLAALLMLSGLLLLVILGAWVGLVQLEKMQRDYLAGSLSVVVDATHGSIRAWMEHEGLIARRLAQDKRLRLLTRNLLQAREGRNTPPGEDLVRSFRARFDINTPEWRGHPFYLIAPDLTTLMARDDGEMDRPSPMAAEWPDRIRMALAGRTVLIPGPSQAGGQPTIYVATPLRGQDEQVIAVLCIGLESDQSISRLCKIGRIGGSGETYVIDRRGRMLSRSRFEDESDRLGLIERGPDGARMISVRDPGGDLAGGYQPNRPRSEHPLTRMAKSAVAGDSGVDVEGYRDYRGVQVLGAWAWDDALGMGVATEVDEEEALATFRAGRMIILGMLLLTVLLALLATGFTLWSGERSRRALRHARDRWEELAERRTADLRKLSRAIEQGSSTVVITDLEGTIEYVNPKFSAVTGYTREEAIGQNPRILKSGKHPPEYYRVMWETITSGEPWHGEMCNRKKNGELYWELVSISPVRDDSGEVTHFVAVKDDLTAFKEAEAELIEARQAADNANRTKSQFLANMSHEIRTPMNAVIGMTHLALQTDLTAKQRDYLTKVESSSHALLGVINDILDFSKIEAGKLDLETIDFSLDEVLDRVATLVATKSEEKGLELLLRKGAEVPTRLRGDPLRLGQILTNLANNAVKFTERGEIVIAVESEEVAPPRVRLRFSVRDTGIGMTEEHRARLFQAFTQADTTTTRKYGGTGLGLSISKRLTHMMNGEIEVESVPGEGSTFSFTAEFEIGRSGPEEALLPHPDLRGCRVLVVDDNPTARGILEDLLSSMSFRVVAAEVARAGLEELERAAHENPIKLVLMDWKMPGMDGFEAAASVRAAPERYGSPRIIMVTAYGREEILRQASEADLDGYLIKPVTQSILLDTIMQAFGKEAEPREPDARRQCRTAPEGRGIHGARILLAEDNEINQQVATELLESAGLHVTVATNGREAVSAATATDADFDLILMDIQMPKLDGYAATRQIRESGRPGCEELPILAMTAHAMTGDREKSIAAGMNDHVTKPIDPDELFHSLQRWIPPRSDPAPVAPPASPGGEGPPLPVLAGIDVAAGLARIGGNLTLYRKLLLRFCEANEGASREFEELIATGDRKEGRHLAHSIKGAAGNLGADALADAAADLESTFRAEEGEPSTACREEFGQRLREVLTGVDGLRVKKEDSPIEDGNEATRPMDPMDRTAVRERLVRLADLLETDISAALDQLEPLRRLLAGTGAAGTLARLARHLDEFETDEAMEVLIELAELLSISL